MLTIAAVILALVVLPSPWGAIVVVCAAIVDIAETSGFLWWSRRRRRQTSPSVGVETILGRSGVAIGWLGPRGSTASGQVRVDGEIWRARAMEPIEAGTIITVVSAKGLTLDVVPGVRTPD